MTEEEKGFGEFVDDREEKTGEFRVNQIFSSSITIDAEDQTDALKKAIQIADNEIIPVLEDHPDIEMAKLEEQVVRGPFEE